MAQAPSPLAGTGAERSLAWALFSWKGRIRRSTFLYGFLAVGLGYLGLVLLIDDATAGPDGVVRDGPAVMIFLGLLVAAYMLLMLAWKRVQDLGHAGWWVLAGIGAASFAGPLALFGLGFLAFFPGKAEANAYGPPPLWKAGASRGGAAH